MKIVEEFHEFTWDMIRSLPMCYYNYKNNIPQKLRCKPGLSDVYYFVNNIEELDRFDAFNNNISYNHAPPFYTMYEWEPPPLKEHYLNKEKLEFDKPTVVIQNKFSLEWNSGPFNYFSEEFLDTLFTLLQDNYEIIYIRPTGDDEKYYKDENEILEFGDYKLIQDKYPNIHTIDKYLNMYPNYSYNIVQCLLEATSDKHIAVSGGNACIAAYFGGDVLVYDSPLGKGAGRGIWKTGSWLSKLGGAQIYGFNKYEDILSMIEEKW